MFNIFEQPWGLLIISGAVLLILLVVRVVLPGRRLWWGLLLPVLLAVSAFGFDYFVKTDAEKVREVIKTAMKAVSQERPEIIGPLISDNYEDSYNRNKDQLMGRLRYRLSKPLVDKNITRIVSTDIQPWNARAVFTVRIIFDEKSYIYQSYKSQAFVKVEMDFEKQLDKSWLIKRAELVELDMQPVSWDEVRQYW
jgi:hypothetical protein